MRKAFVAGTITCVVAFASVFAQQPDADMKKITDDYLAAFNSGDAKALAALHTTDAVRLTQTGELLKGRTAIEQDFAKALAGPFKGAKLAVIIGSVQAITPDVRHAEGTYEVTGPVAMKGRYVTTLVRQGGQWRYAGMATINTPPTAPR